MKEERFFFTPDITSSTFLPDDEAQHAVRVLRLKEGDELWAMDGRGHFYRCEIALATKKACQVNVCDEFSPAKTWTGTLTIAIAPTKNLDRIEWMVEKAVEIGVDRIVPLLCKNSERTSIKTERLERIAVSAMKQSRKPWLTEIWPMTPFGDFITAATGSCYIAHCHDDLPPRIPLIDIPPRTDTTVLIGPEGDFSRDEVLAALDHGFTSVSLGASRLRTETAGIVATHIMQLKNQSRQIL